MGRRKYIILSFLLSLEGRGSGEGKNLKISTTSRCAWKKHQTPTLRNKVSNFSRFEPKRVNSLTKLE